MLTKELLAGAALALVLVSGAYAQTSPSAGCPSGTMTIQKAESEGVAKAPKLAETEGAGKGPKLAETEGAGKGPKLADTEGAGKGPRHAAAEGVGKGPRLASTEAGMSASPKLASGQVNCQ